MASHVVSFLFSSWAGGAMAFRLVQSIVSFLILRRRPALRPVAVSCCFVLLFFSSRFSPRVGVPLLVSCRCYPVAPFLSARVPVSSRRCRRSIRVRPVVRVGWRRVVEALRRGVAWSSGCGRYGCCVDICDAGRYAMRVGRRFGDAVSCVVACRERDEGRDVWRDEGRDDERAVFVSSIWSFIVLFSVGVGSSGSSRPSPPWNKIPRRMGAG